MDLSVLSDLCDDYTDDFVVDPSEVKRLSSVKIHKAVMPNGVPNRLLHDFSAVEVESIQKRAVGLHIIFNFTRGMSYLNLSFVANINSLKSRRNEHSRSFFQKCVIQLHVHITSSYPLATLL